MEVRGHIRDSTHSTSDWQFIVAGWKFAVK